MECKTAKVQSQNIVDKSSSYPYSYSFSNFRVTWVLHHSLPTDRTACFMLSSTRRHFYHQRRGSSRATVMTSRVPLAAISMTSPLFCRTPLTTSTPTFTGEVRLVRPEEQQPRSPRPQIRRRRPVQTSNTVFSPFSVK